MVTELFSVGGTSGKLTSSPQDAIALVRKTATSKVVRYVKKNAGISSEDPHVKDFVKLKSKKLFMSPNVMNHRVIGCFGASGSGKSWFMRNLAMAYHKEHKRPVYLFSAKNEDATLDKKKKAGYDLLKGKLPIKQVTISHEMLNDFTSEYILEHFKDSMILFDDVIVHDKGLMAGMHKLCNSVLMLGRQAKIHCVVSRHELQDLQNKSLKSECSAIVVFPHSSFRKHIIDFMKGIGISKHGMDQVMSTPDRWVFLSVFNPLFALTPSSVFSIQ
jgi:energy-coupling factor transporter ATP-binding protein EcfA2